jgi:hypothetical protein
MKKDYNKEIVYIHDKLLNEMANLLVMGVERRNKEIHLEFYFKLPDGKIFHRDIEVQPDGNYDSGCMMGDVKDIVIKALMTTTPHIITKKQAEKMVG